MNVLSKPVAPQSPVFVEPKKVKRGTQTLCHICRNAINTPAQTANGTFQLGSPSVQFREVVSRGGDQDCRCPCLDADECHGHMLEHTVRDCAGLMMQAQLIDGSSQPSKSSVAHDSTRMDC